MPDKITDGLDELREVVQRLLKRRILVVEDDPNDALLTMSTIEKLGDLAVEGVRVETAAEAVKCLKENYYSICLLDLRLPDSDDPVELVDRIRSANPRVPIGILTGDSRIEELRTILRKHVAAVLPKPITEGQLRGVFQT